MATNSLNNLLASVPELITPPLALTLSVITTQYLVSLLNVTDISEAVNE